MCQPTSRRISTKVSLKRAATTTHLSKSPLDLLLPLLSLDRRRLAPELLRRPAFPTTVPPNSSSSQSAAVRPLLPSLLPVRLDVVFRCFRPEDVDLDDRELAGEPAVEAGLGEVAAGEAADCEATVGDFTEVLLIVPSSPKVLL